MFTKVLAVAAVSAYASAEQDLGMFAGMKTGFFLPDEQSFINYNCPQPEVPEMFKQAEAMIPMVKMMSQQMNAGVVPKPVIMLEELFEDFIEMASVVKSMAFGYEGSEFCKGLVLVHTGKAFSGKVMHELGPLIGDKLPFAFPALQ